MKAGWLPKLLITPSALLVLVCVYGYIMFTTYLSFTSSTILPVLQWEGNAAYKRLFNLENWDVSLANLWVFASLYIFSLIGLLIGLVSDLMYTWIDPRIDFETREV